MLRGKQDTTRNISCSVSFASTFVLYFGNLDYFLDSVGEHIVLNISFIIFEFTAIMLQSRL